MSLQKKCQICRHIISRGERCSDHETTVPTHVIVGYPEHKTHVLFRASDGIGLAQMNQVVVVVGENKNQNVSRVFLDELHAETFLREVIPMFDLAGHDIKPLEGKGYIEQLAKAREAVGHGVVIIETRDGGRGLILPANAAEMPTTIKAFRSN